MKKFKITLTFNSEEDMKTADSYLHDACDDEYSGLADLDIEYETGPVEESD